jgi:hypothetical protein
MLCEEIRAFLLPFLDSCKESESGASIATHCLYPSATPVRVFIAKVGGGFKVHDGGAAAQEAWLHGRDQNVILNCLRKESAHYGLELINGALWADAQSPDWLAPAILAVANGSAHAASAAVMKTSAAFDEVILAKIQTALSAGFRETSIVKEFHVRGKSGKEHRFDFAVYGRGTGILINAISPHHNSVANKYVAFADTESEGSHKFAVFERGLEPEDVALIQQVAELVPLGSLIRGAKRVFSRAH